MNVPVAAHEILEQGAQHMRDRAKTYDSPEGERSMGKTVTMFNALHGTDITETQGWQFMELLKMVRSSQGEFKLDNFEDGAAYCALAGESAARALYKAQQQAAINIINKRAADKKPLLATEASPEFPLSSGAVIVGEQLKESAE